MQARRAERCRGLLGALGLTLWVACTPASYVSEADRAVGLLLSEKNAQTLDGREGWVRRPEELPPEAEDQGASLDQAGEATESAGEIESAAEVDGEIDDALGRSEEGPRGSEPEEELEIDLERALGIAVETAREYVTRRESVYLQGLGLTGTRFDFGPQLAATVGHVWSTTEDGPTDNVTRTDFSVSQILATGGTATASVGWLTDPRGGATGDRLFSSTANFGVSQPLMRGAGYTVSHEPLTQAERSLVYELRDFELFRQDFSIAVAQDYFNLVSQRTRLSNEEQNYRGAIFDREKAEAFRQVDRNRDEDLFLARRRAIDAENRLLQAQTDYQLAVDTFRIRLGLPPSVRLVIAEIEPPFTPVRLQADSAVEVAIHNRLDLINARAFIVDRERGVRIARNGLLPDVDLDLGYTLVGADESDFVDSAPEDSSARAGLSVEIPLQRVRERNTVRSAMISLDREKRSYDLLVENTARDVRDRLRTLDRVEQQIDLQRANIVQEERAVAVTELRYESGDAENRDLLDARQALINAQNALIDLKVEHYIGRLRLLRELGLLFIDEAGRMST